MHIIHSHGGACAQNVGGSRAGLSIGGARCTPNHCHGTPPPTPISVFTSSCCHSFAPTSSPSHPYLANPLQPPLFFFSPSESRLPLPFLLGCLTATAASGSSPSLGLGGAPPAAGAGLPLSPAHPAWWRRGQPNPHQSKGTTPCRVSHRKLQASNCSMFVGGALPTLCPIEPEKAVAEGGGGDAADTSP